MTIGPGRRVGPYEVVSLIGEGGMGKVWRAHHTLLKRDDALKALPGAFTTDRDRLGDVLAAHRRRVDAAVHGPCYEPKHRVSSPQRNR